MTSKTTVDINFTELGLTDSVLKVLNDVGYEKPSPIQAEIIPYVLEGRDVIGQAQTGTGKTAAFALPLLSKIDPKCKDTQVLVLTPTRELAIQVAEAFQRYAKHIKGLNILPIYGGQDYSHQLRQLKRGVQIVVGTPGRVMDHMRRNTLTLENLECLVLDEADEMLRMGFIDDVEWVLDAMSEDAQIALFSATMPNDIRRIAQKYLKSPAEITIKMKTVTASTISQRCWIVGGMHKLDALTRILEVEDFEAILIFVRTKTATVELADKLSARGYATAALNGDIAQKQREYTIEQLKKSKIDILVATDVAARGLDVERLSHVVNYDIPYDTESYVHRIGRTGRAGRSGEAILFVAPRERRMLSSIERVTKQKIKMMSLPSTETVNEKRILSFKQSITDILASEDKELELFRDLVTTYQQENEVDAINIAAALAKLQQGGNSFLLTSKPQRTRERFDDSYSSRRDRDQQKGGRSRERSFGRKKDVASEEGMEHFRIEVGSMHGVKPGNIVGAIANEINLDSANIGRIDIREDHSFVDLPKDLDNHTIDTLKNVWVSGQKLKISTASHSDNSEKKRSKPYNKRK